MKPYIEKYQVRNMQGAVHLTVFSSILRTVVHRVTYITTRSGGGKVAVAGITSLTAWAAAWRTFKMRWEKSFVA